jgi:hypothetical protein
MLICVKPPGTGLAAEAETIVSALSKTASPRLKQNLLKKHQRNIGAGFVQGIFGLRRQSGSGDGVFERAETQLDPKIFRASESGGEPAAVQDAGALPDNSRNARSVLECACPLSLCCALPCQKFGSTRGRSGNSVEDVKRAGFMTRRLFKVFAIVSLVAFFVTLFLWWSGQFLGVGFNYEFVHKIYCELDCAAGRIEFSVTRPNGMPCLIERRKGIDGDETWSSGAPRTEAYSYLASKTPRIFEAFGFSHQYSELGGLHSIDEPPDSKVWYTRIDVPYWFLALLFAVAPILRMINRKEEPAISSP